MNTPHKLRLLHAGLILALAALACNMPNGAATETPTPAPATETATITPTSTVDPASLACVATATKDINMRTGPGTDWDVIGQMTGGNSAQVTGHNGDRTWWQIGGNAWVSAPLTTTTGNCEAVLVVGYPPAPTKKAANHPTKQPSKTSTPQPAGTFVFPIKTLIFPVGTFVIQTDDVAFEVDFSSKFSCGTSARVSFSIYNQGNVAIESLYYSVEAPSGTYRNPGETSNAPFKASATESQPACSQAGQDSLAVGQGRYFAIPLSAFPPNGTEGFLYIEACSGNNRSGTCESQIAYFNF